MYCKTSQKIDKYAHGVITSQVAYAIIKIYYSSKQLLFQVIVRGFLLNYVYVIQNDYVTICYTIQTIYKKQKRRVL